MLFWSFLLKRYRAWKAYRETYAELARLDVPTLVDIGVPWAGIGAAARRAGAKAAA